MLFIFILSLASCTRDSEKEIFEHRLNDILIKSMRQDLNPEHSNINSVQVLMTQMDSLKRKADAECEKAKDRMIEAQSIYIKLLETRTDTSRTYDKQLRNKNS